MLYCREIVETMTGKGDREIGEDIWGSKKTVTHGPIRIIYRSVQYHYTNGFQ